MAKKSQKKNSKKVLAFDLGGTKLALAVVNQKGQILTEQRVSVSKSGGAKSLIDQMANLAKPLVKEFGVKSGAIASAGPLDPRAGVLLNPTNFKTAGQSWGVVPLVAELRKKIKIPLTLENDAAAAALAEKWLGAGQGSDNLVILTLGTGLGVGVIANGELVRSGRYLHPEAGHIIISVNDKEWLCGCGNYGCAEAMLSGVNFTKKLAERWSEPDLTGERLVSRARLGEEKAIQEFKKYGELLATYICSIVVLFSPEKVILSGGFSHAADLFLPACRARLIELIKTRRSKIDLMPEVLLSPFRDEAGIIGAAFIALNI